MGKNIRLLIGLVALAAGVGVLVWGIIALNQATESLQGAIVGRLFGRQTEDQRQAIILIIVGAVAAVVGLALLLIRGGGKAGKKRK